MSGLLTPKTASLPPTTPVSTLRLQTSARDRPIPLVYGRARVSGNLIWYGDFVATGNQTSSGGKGGHSTTTSYTYSTAFEMAICEGVINSLPKIWKDKNVYVGQAITSGILTVRNEYHVAFSSNPTVTVVNSANFYGDLGVQQVLNAGSWVTLVAGTDYTVDAHGNYTFQSYALGQLYISYSYTVTSGTGDASSALGLSLYTGTLTQTAPAWMTSKHPGQDLGYRGTAYVAASSYAMGDIPDLSNHSFEVDTASGFSASNRDANPKDVIIDLLTNPRYGLGFPANKIGDVTQFSNYCVANSVFISPVYQDQKPMSDILTALMNITNSGIVFSDGLLKILPFSDTAASGNGAVFTPVNTPLYDLTDDQFIVDGNEDPIKVTRVSPADAYNHVRATFSNRDIDYNPDVADAEDLLSIQNYGLRSMSVLDMPEVCNSTSARSVVQLMLQRLINIRNTYEFKLGWNFAILEPMDLVTLTDPQLGMNRVPVRITAIEEDKNGSLTITAEDYPVNTLTAAAYNIQPAGGYSTNYNVDPGSALTPVIFEAPVTLAGNKLGLEIWLATGSTNANYGGCQIWVSTDNATYVQAGELVGSSRFGMTTSSLGAQSASGMYNDTVGVQLSAGGQLLAATENDAELLNTLCYLDGEYTAYRDATLTGAGAYTIGRLNRGAYYSLPVAHASGVQFVRCDDAIAKLALNSVQYVGQTIYVKLLAYNIYGGAVQSLANVTATSYAVTGKFVNAPPIEVSGFGLQGTFNIGTAKIQWNAVPNAVSYDFQVWAGTTLAKVRDVVVGNSLTFDYTALDATADGGPWRSLTFKVAPISATGIYGAYNTLVVNNPQVGVLANATVTAGPLNMQFHCTLPTDPDYAGIRIYMSTTTGFTPGPSNLVHDGPSNSVTVSYDASGIAIANGTVYYVRAAGYDTLGKDSLNFTSELSFTGALAASSKNAQAYLYQWSPTQPGNPSGTSTYTWATGVSSAYSGGNGWQNTVPTNPGTPGLLLWITSTAVTAASSATTTSVTWTGVTNVYNSAQNGAAGTPGTQASTPTIYTWAATIPSPPSGTVSYTWSSGALSAIPSGWFATPGSGSPGQTLWADKVNLVDTAGATSTSFNWSSGSISAVGYNGSNGGTGTAGASYRTAYLASSVSSPSTSPNPQTDSGSTTTPGNNTVFWGLGGSWSTSPPTLSAGQYQYQSDGIYNPATNQTTWSIPYWSSLKVGSLSAISANLGTVTSGTIIGNLIETATSGQRIAINESNNNELKAYDSSGNLVCEIGGSSGTIYVPNTSSLSPSIYGTITGAAAAVAGQNNGSGAAVQGINSSSGAAGRFVNSASGLALSVTGPNTIDGAITVTARAAGASNAQMNSVIAVTDNAYQCGYLGARWQNIYAANNVIQTSDVRTKENIETCEFGLQFIMQLQPKQYTMIVGQNIVSEDENGNTVITPRKGVRTHYGFISQDVKVIIGDRNLAMWSLENKDDPNSSQALMYTEFIPPIVKAIQELTTRVVALEAKNQ